MCSTAGCATCHMPLLDSQLAIMEAFPNAKRMLRRLLWRECVQDAHVACHRAKTLSVSLSRCLVSRMWSALSGGTCGFPVNQTAACRMRLAVRSCLLPLPAAVAVAGIKTKLFPPTRKKGRQLAQFDFGPTHTHAHTHSGRGCVSCCVLRLLAAPPAAFVGLDAARRSDPLRRDLCPCSPLAHPLAVQQSQRLSLSLSHCLTVPLGLINCGHRSWCWDDSTLR